jgi:hypothetical protein
MTTEEEPRFSMSGAGSNGFQYWIIRDAVSGRIVANSFSEADARLIVTKLNEISDAGGRLYAALKGWDAVMNELPVISIGGGDTQRGLRLLRETRWALALAEGQHG